MADDTAGTAQRGSKSPTPPKSPPRTPPPGSQPGSPPPAEAPASPPASTPAPDIGILPADHWTENPVEDDDAESALGESVTESTASISSSILNYRTLHGRRYHSEIGNAHYWGANDEPSSESMDINHHGLTLGIGGRLYLAPLVKDNVKRVLDVGTGTGIWAIDFADEFPEAEVTGTDISPIQPSWIPPNLKFEIEDYTREWTFNPNTFDFIHLRWLLGSVPDWYALFEEAYKATKPGGWIQSHEPSCIYKSDHTTIAEDSALGQWGKFYIEGGKKMGNTCLIVEEDLQKKGMEAAGFVDIQEFNYKTPMGPWPKDPVMKELGTLGQVALEADIEGYILFMASTVGWTREEIQVYISHFRREIRSGKFCPYFTQRVVWGRKPEEAAEASA